jgi:hypothetical protein
MAKLVRLAEEAVAEAVDHVEDRIQVRDRLPERRQRVDGVEHAGQEGERHHDEILEGRELVELVGPDAGDDAERWPRMAPPTNANASVSTERMRSGIDTHSVTSEHASAHTSPRMTAASM